ncbi:hypothetical protein WJR50_15795 [Catalinimonas sp. 4WD22]|uniref:hypothetical protein n=1 Tax=Catalinimonas locisalis TaxID=3133978 RepID=UPI0031015B9A
MLFQSCHQYDAHGIEGHWQLDSIHHFYNHFHYTEIGDQARQYQYSENKLRIIQANNKLEMLYEIQQDTLKWMATHDEKNISKYQIISLKQNNMILKEELKPLFSQSNQSRYQLYYFSRLR